MKCPRLWDEEHYFGYFLTSTFISNLKINKFTEML